MDVSRAGKYGALYLYAGPTTTKSSAVKSVSSSPSSASPSAQSGDLIQVLDAAKAASAGLSNDKSQIASTPKSKIDAIYADAKARGISITLDLAKPGEPLDFSSFTDDERGKIANDKNGEFSTDLSDYARGALNARVAVTLQPYAWSLENGDRRGQATAIDKLYEQMSPDTRAALGWNESMMEANDRMRDGDTRLFGKFDGSAVIANLLQASQNGGLSFNDPQG